MMAALIEKTRRWYIYFEQIEIAIGPVVHENKHAFTKASSLEFLRTPIGDGHPSYVIPAIFSCISTVEEGSRRKVQLDHEVPLELGLIFAVRL